MLEIEQGNTSSFHKALAAGFLSRQRNLSNFLLVEASKGANQKNFRFQVHVQFLYFLSCILISLF